MYQSQKNCLEPERYNRAETAEYRGGEMGANKNKHKSAKNPLRLASISVQLPESGIKPDMEEHPMTAWTLTEKSRKKQVMAGETVVAHLRKDWRLIRWAKEHGLFVRIDRMTQWGNMFVLGEDGDRDAVCDLYRARIVRQLKLMEQLDTLRGKVLGCHCYPNRCHGNELVELLAEQGQAVLETPDEHHAHR